MRVETLYRDKNTKDDDHAYYKDEQLRIGHHPTGAAQRVGATYKNYGVDGLLHNASAAAALRANLTYELMYARRAFYSVQNVRLLRTYGVGLYDLLR